jgi:poly(A) polymerase
VTRLAGAWRTAPGPQSVCALLAGAGHQALFVGGCVRNDLLGIPVADVDIATDAHPDRVLALAAAAGFRAVPTGIDHGTITVIAGGEGHEVTTFRRDVETFGRHARVVFSDRVEEDAARRDFTMNALYATATGELVDPLCGLPDLLARRLRFVGDAAARIAEDSLRILRFFRFHAWFADPAGGFDAEGLAACAAAADGIGRLSRERVGAEMRKLLSAPDPAPALAAMAAAGVLARALPGADHTPLALLVHLEAGASPDWLRRLAALGGQDPEAGLRLSRAEARRLAALRQGALSAEPPAALGWRLGAAAGGDAVLVRAALTGAPVPAGAAAEVARGAAATFPVAAADLMPALAGAALGERLREIERRWIDSGLRLTRDELIG